MIKKYVESQDAQSITGAVNIAPGANFNYTYIVQNTGSGTATGVTVTDTLPSFISVRSLPTGANWQCSNATKVIA